MKEIIVEAAKWGTMLYILGAIIVGIILTSCSGSYEGAGFYNSGRAPGASCVDRDSRGNERWRSC